MSEKVSSKIPFFTLGEAAKQAGVSKPTLSKAIKTGRISAEKQPNGSYRIQPAELFRGGFHNYCWLNWFERRFCAAAAQVWETRQGQRQWPPGSFISSPRLSMPAT